MTARLAILAACLLAGCSTDPKESYPRGFTAGGQMFYWNPCVARWVFGPKEVTPRDPLAQGWVVTTMRGEVYVSPKLQRAIGR